MKNIIFTTLFSLFVFVLSAQNFTMNNGSITTCSGLFFDSGGRDRPYQPGEDKVFTISCNNQVSVLTISFAEFNLADGDWLAVYDGSKPGSDIIDTYTKENPLIGDVKSTKGSLTFVFHSGIGSSANGWSASISNTTSENNEDAHSCNHADHGVVYIYLTQGLKSEEDGKKLEQLLNKLEYVIDSEVHFVQQNLYVTALGDDYAYKIKDYILTLESVFGYVINIDFYRAVDQRN